MRAHFIEGAAGCAFAVEHQCVAIVVDALRASATAAMFLHVGARALTVVREVETALAYHATHPDALLFGERGGLPPEGFHGGNSPRQVAAAKGRDVVFTTTTGAGRLVACWGAHAVYMGTTINATAVVRAACAHARDIVVIPAGLSGDNNFDAVEDRAAAAWLVRVSQLAPGEGSREARDWARRIDDEGLPALFERAPHAEKLRAIQQGDDVAWCARIDVTGCVPRGVAHNDYGVVLQHDGQ